MADYYSSDYSDDDDSLNPSEDEDDTFDEIIARDDDIFESLARSLMSPVVPDDDAPAAPAAPDAPSIRASRASRERAPAVVAAAASACAESIEDGATVARYEDDAQELATDPEHFDAILPTTFGLSGGFSGVAFNESELIKHIAPFLQYPCIRAVCNDGMVSVPDFDEIVERFGISLSADRKTKRSREKKQRRTSAKPRKVHGEGTSFNSSILFWIHSEKFRVIYKLRLFRNGHFGLPGTKPEMIRDIIDMRDTVFIPLLARILQAAGGLPELPDVRATNLVPIMKNYKWRRIVAPGMILNLSIVAGRMRERQETYIPSPFRIHYAQYGDGDTKISVSFSTPTEARATKAIRVNIFQSGKINILGAHALDVTKKICQYLALVINDDVIVHARGNEEDLTESSDDEPLTDEECLRDINDPAHWLTQAVRAYIARTFTSTPAHAPAPTL